MGERGEMAEGVRKEGEEREIERGRRTWIRGRSGRETCRADCLSFAGARLPTLISRFESHSSFKFERYCLLNFTSKEYDLLSRSNERLHQGD